MCKRRSKLFTVLAVVGFVAAATGCYEHVIRSEGIGGDRVDTYEPNSKGEPDVLDDIMWGSQPKKK